MMPTITAPAIAPMGLRRTMLSNSDTALFAWLFVDGAGNHQSDDLEVPGNIMLHVLPPYSPDRYFITRVLAARVAPWSWPYGSGRGLRREFDATWGQRRCLIFSNSSARG